MTTAADDPDARRATFRALRLHDFTGPSGLRLDELEVPEPQGDEVLIDVEAFSLNYGDFELMENGYVFSMALPARIGDEAAGVVAAVGPDVAGLTVGDRVSTLPFMNEGYGVDGEFALCPERFVARYPERLTAAQGCSIWVPYLTAYYALHEISGITQADFVLLTAASSSAALAAMQLARRVGARTIGLTRSAAGVEFLRDAGYDHVVIAGSEDIADEVLEITGGAGARVVYDPIGGPLMTRYARAVAWKAQVFLYGGIDPAPTVIPEIEFTQRAAVIRPYSVYHHVYDADERERGVRFVTEALEAGEITPFVDRTFPLVDFADAFAYQQQATGRRGKVVVRVDE